METKLLLIAATQEYNGTATNQVNCRKEWNTKKYVTPTHPHVARIWILVMLIMSILKHRVLR